MKKFFNPPVFLLLAVLYPVIFCEGQPNNGLKANKLFARKYKAGDKYRYKIKLVESHGGTWAFTNEAICELTVMKDSAGVPYDEVRWLSMKVTDAKGDSDETHEALAVKPYRISLDVRGKVDLPVINVGAMAEPIQDFNTFFVAVSPLLGQIDKLQKEGDSMAMAKPVTANFANGTNMLLGQDCLAISAAMLKNDKENVLLRTYFMPPAQPCLTYASPDMQAPVVKDTLNNFQMVQPSANDMVNVNYGREFFYITSTVRKADGKIEKADMYNQLNLKIKVNCDKSYKNCQVEVPFAETRELSIQLL